MIRIFVSQPKENGLHLEAELWSDQVNEPINTTALCEMKEWPGFDENILHRTLYMCQRGSMLDTPVAIVAPETRYRTALTIDVNCWVDLFVRLEQTYDARSRYQCPRQASSSHLRLRTTGIPATALETENWHWCCIETFSLCGQTFQMILEPGGHRCGEPRKWIWRIFMR